MCTVFKFPPRLSNWFFVQLKLSTFDEITIFSLFHSYACDFPQNFGKTFIKNFYGENWQTVFSWLPDLILMIDLLKYFGKFLFVCKLNNFNQKVVNLSHHRNLNSILSINRILVLKWAENIFTRQLLTGIIEVWILLSYFMIMFWKIIHVYSVHNIQLAT